MAQDVCKGTLEVPSNQTDDPILSGRIWRWAVVSRAGPIRRTTRNFTALPSLIPPSGLRHSKFKSRCIFSGDHNTDQNVVHTHIQAQNKKIRHQDYHAANMS